LTGALWLVVTLVVYLLSRELHARTRIALLNPALVSIALLIALLSLTGTPYEQYASGGRLLSFWLGPAVVALGLPLALQLATVRRNALGIGLALLAGTVVGIVFAVVVAHLLGATPEVVRSLAPRSATTPIAVAVSARLGGIPAISAVVSIVSGAVGAVIGVQLLRLAGVRSPLATGLALGAAAHGLGTARASSEGAPEAAAAGMAMGAVGVGTALLAPLVMRVIGWG
jgi:predicted murein hydrolase (TIGR00659 family)